MSGAVGGRKTGAVDAEGDGQVLQTDVVDDLVVAALQECGVDTFIEVGAGTTLSGLVKKTLTDVKIMNVTDMASLQNVIQELTGKAE